MGLVFRSITRKTFVSLRRSSVLFLILLSTACSKYKSGDVIDNNDVVPPSPSILSYFTVEGSDDDLDGVRDDIEIWINENFDDPNIRMALKQEARLWYFYMFAESPEELNKISFEIEKSSPCLYAVSSYLRYVLPKEESEKIFSKKEMLKNKLLNNWWRQEKMDDVNKYTSSGTYSLERKSILKGINNCNFKVVNLKSILEAYSKSPLYRNNTPSDEVEQLDEFFKEL